MKKLILVLVIIATATTAYNQSSRRTTNANSTTTQRKSSENSTYASNSTSNRKVSSNVSAQNTTSSAKVQRSHIASKNYQGNNYYTNRNHKYNVKKVNYSVHYNYRLPVNVNVVWTEEMHRHYVTMYPSHRWTYRYGYNINNIPANEARLYIGDVKNVYGQITDMYYAPESDEYLFYIGRYYPNQCFTIIVPGYIARNYSRRPGQYFMNQYIHVTGLISQYGGKPEIIVKRNSQINVY
jgi:hypothetical protein